MGEAPPSAHDAGGRTPAGDRAVVSGTRRKPGFPRAAREAAAGARPVARTTVPDRRGEAVAPDTVGTNASHVYAVGGKTPAPRCTVISRTERQPGTQGADRETPQGARPTPGATVAEPDREAVAPGTGGEARHAFTLLEERLQRHDAQLSQERNDNQAQREQLEKLRLERDQLQERLSQIDEEKQSLLTQVGEARHAYTVLEEGLQRHDNELSQERNDNQSSREQLEKLRLERDQLQEQLSQIQMEKQSVLAQLEQMRLSHAQMEERIKRLEERLMQEQQD